MTKRIYAIADSHGQIAMLHRALDLFEADGRRDEEIMFLGDYVDRGPDSKAVLDLLIEGVAAGQSWCVLKGNHDRMFHRFLTSGTVKDERISNPNYDWLHPALGGMETLASYGVRGGGRPVEAVLTDAQEAVPQGHLAFIAGLDLMAERGPLLFVHAGIRPGIALPDQVEDDLVWIREPFLSHAEPFAHLIVHGHTELQAPEHFGNRIDLDGGAGFGRPLVPVVFEGTDCFVLPDQGRKPLRPASNQR